MAWKNERLPLDISVKLIYTDNVCPLNSRVDISDGIIITISEKYE